jgi:hypothetical protein
LVGWGDMPTCRLAGAGQGGKGLPLGNPGPLAYADCREGPELRVASTGREPHAIPGVTLPFAVILTAHRLRPPLRPARQTASSFGVTGMSNRRLYQPMARCEYWLLLDWGLKRVISDPFELFILRLLSLIIIELQQVPFIAIKILEYHDSSVFFLSRLLVEYHVIRLHQLIIPPKVIGLQK